MKLIQKGKTHTPATKRQRPHHTAIFEISQPTISITIHRIENALEQLPDVKIPGLESLQNIPSSLVVDGTPVPV